DWRSHSGQRFKSLALSTQNGRFELRENFPASRNMRLSRLAIAFRAVFQEFLSIPSIGAKRGFSSNPEYVPIPDSDTGESMDRVLTAPNTCESRTSR
ncbi:MAG: hypothetical protein AB1861_09435, partial [Cyanobacteriota bacterium]